MIGDIIDQNSWELTANSGIYTNANEWKIDYGGSIYAYTSSSSTSEVPINNTYSYDQTWIDWKTMFGKDGIVGLVFIKDEKIFVLMEDKKELCIGSLKDSDKDVADSIVVVAAKKMLEE